MPIKLKKTNIQYDLETPEKGWVILGVDEDGNLVKKDETGTYEKIVKDETYGIYLRLETDFLTIGNRVTDSTEGLYSLAQGNQIKAENIYSTAIGLYTESIGDFSYSRGESLTSDGVYSYVSGKGFSKDYHLISSGKNSFVHTYVDKLSSRGDKLYGTFFSDYSVILGGLNNMINDLAHYSVILGGKNNIINQGIDFTTILSSQDVIATEPYTVYTTNIKNSNILYTNELYIESELTLEGGLNVDEINSINTTLEIKNNTTINGYLNVSGNIQIGTTTEPATSSNSGSLRYIETPTNGYLEQSIKIGTDSYSWIPISNINGSNYVMVYGKGTPQENAVELQSAYDKAKTMPIYLGSIPYGTEKSYKKEQTYYSQASSKYYKLLIDYEGVEEDLIINVEKKEITELEAKSVITTLIIAPGNYTFGVTKFTVNTAYINIVSLTGNADVIIDGINVTASNIYLKGLNCGVNSFNISSGLSNLNCEKCIGGDYSFGFTDSGDFTLSGSTFIDCVGGDYSFGFSSSNILSFYNLTFNNCVSGDYSFGEGYDVGIIYSTFNNCVGGNYSFGYASYNCTIENTTFNDCVSGTDSFGYGSGISISYVTYNDCVGAGGSYNGISSTTKLYRCRLTSGTFTTPISGGKIIICIDGNDDIITSS